MSNVTLIEHFDAGLGSWTLDATGGTVSIVTTSQSTKLQLNDTSAVALVSAKRTLTMPSTKYIIEYDMYYAASGAGVFELLDASNNVLATVSGGLTANTLSFSTNTVAATTKTWTEATYNQIVLVIDPVGNTIACYWIDKSYSASGYNPLQLVASKAFSGTVATQISFRTDSTKTGIAYVDEVHVYTPDFAIIGDSISDGKIRWSSDPSTIWRTTATYGVPDQTSPPQYQLGALLGTNFWVAGRGFGGSRMSEIVTFVQSLIVNQGFQRVAINVGVNSLNAGVLATSLETDLTTIVNTLVAGGISTSNIYVCNIYGTSLLSAAEHIERAAYNSWLITYCAGNGVHLVDADASLSNYPTSPNTLKSTYDAGDGVHLNKTGTSILTQLIYNLIPISSIGYSFGMII